MLTNYKVREGFVVHLKRDGQSYKPGTVVKMDADEAQDHILQIEEMAAPVKQADDKKPTDGQQIKAAADALKAPDDKKEASKE